MDQIRFDGIARALGRDMTRRAGVAGVAAALAGLAGARALPAPEAAEAAGKRRHRKGDRSARPEGPCGDRSRKDNVCTKNTQCCTGFCLKGLKNRDGKGRCRCIRKGKPCNPSQTCCKKRQCVDGRCGEKAAPAPEVCLVCATGCKYASVSAAYAGEPAGTVIPIAAGRYGTGIAATKSMTLKACNEVSGVILYPDGSVTTEYYTPPRPVILKETTDRTAAATVTLIGLNLEPSAPAASEVLIEAANWDVQTPLSIELEDCDLSGAECVKLGPGAHVISGTTIHQCADSGVYVEVDANAIGGRGVTLDVSNSSFLDNASYGLDMDGENAIPGRQLTVFNISGSTFTGNDGAGMVMYGGTFSVSDCIIQGNGNVVSGEGGILITGSTVTITNTSISGNTCVEFGGGLKIATFESADITVTIAGTTSITGNAAPEGSGIGVDASDTSVTVLVTGANGSNVTGNTGGDQCDRTTVSGPYVWNVVPNCAF